MPPFLNPEKAVSVALGAETLHKQYHFAPLTPSGMLHHRDLNPPFFSASVAAGGVREVSGLVAPEGLAFRLFSSPWGAPAWLRLS